ncbi:LytR/AlgR family response regulator transcription factor [Hymenobacter cheonanensis]|uniref:LytR/AlgR family response regulator transcription factor n=1 Tax=Hymenobacter sp. CA2-7 TaxID=3063993 RepID=UPI00271411B5|nr:LytTR family DNA-binding domain-containing protein [Hymenobacter sp. CA2-7]MDO7884591.1 LytTR family DNA-binding domain-containing protein [Hymenobacter sp. CA2-7]
MSAPRAATCVIVDNNEIDVYLTEHLVGLTEGLQLVASFTSAPAALAFLRAHPEINMLLLDVEMPELSGMELLRQLPRPHPAVIIISGHRSFAIEAFDLHVADYLVKPVEYPRFQEAVRRLLGQPAPGAAALAITPPPKAPPSNGPGPEVVPESNDLFVKVNNRLVRLNFDEVLYIEAMSTYSVLVTARQKFIVHYTLKSIAERLPFAHFRRVHRSYIINTRLIDSIEDNILTLAGYEVPLAKSYQDELLHSLRSL